jgi:hypothetical protein
MLVQADVVTGVVQQQQRRQGRGAERIYQLALLMKTVIQYLCSRQSSTSGVFVAVGRWWTDTAEARGRRE